MLTTLIIILIPLFWAKESIDHPEIVLFSYQSISCESGADSDSKMAVMCFNPFAHQKMLKNGVASWVIFG